MLDSLPPVWVLSTEVGPAERLALGRLRRGCRQGELSRNEGVEAGLPRAWVKVRESPASWRGSPRGRWARAQAPGSAPAAGPFSPGPCPPSAPALGGQRPRV